MTETRTRPLPPLTTEQAAVLQNARTAETTAKDFARDRDESIRAAAALGVPNRRIAAEVGLSHQRVHQIIHAQ